MAKLTREEVIDRVRKGKSLEGEDLSELDLGNADLSGANLASANLASACLAIANLRGANLSGANLRNTDLNGAQFSEANLFRANLIGAKLSDANLREANLRESTLNSANFEFADLSGADLTGANIFNIATAYWRIDGVKCEYAYSFHNFWITEEKEKTRRNFAPGEFEQIYKSFPKLELIFKGGFSGIDFHALLEVIDRINQELPIAHLKLRKLEKIVDTTVTLTAETKEAVEEIANKLPEQYAKIQAELKKMKGLLEIAVHLPERML